MKKGYFEYFIANSCVTFNKKDPVLLNYLPTAMHMDPKHAYSNAVIVHDMQGSVVSMTQHRTCISSWLQNINKNWHKLFTFGIV